MVVVIAARGVQVACAACIVFVERMGGNRGRGRAAPATANGALVAETNHSLVGETGGVLGS